MKTTFPLALLLAAVLLAPSATSLRADDWKTTDGKVYQSVRVVKSAPDAVTILHQDGGALVPLANLPPELQKRFNYDPAKAKVAAEARAKDDAENARALQAERDQAAAMRQARLEAQDPDAPRTYTADAASTKPISSNASHHSMDDLAASAQSLRSDPSGPPHYSMDDLAASAHSLRPDFTGPLHYSIGGLAASAHSLSSDPSGPPHYSMSEATGSGF